MWVPAFACPSCQTAMSCGECGCTCGLCGSVFPRTDGVFRCAGPARLAAASPFLDQYRGVRRADGHGGKTVDQYRALPTVSRDDPNVAEWRIRHQSYALVRRRALARKQAAAATGWSSASASAIEGPLRRAPATRVLDAGAGNGWMSNRLAQLGHEPVAVDLNDDPLDGLLACRNYETVFPLVQADFDALPFAPGQFDLVVMNASLHYSPEPDRTLLEMNRMVASGGALVVMDSPMFEDSQDGEAMVAGQLERLQGEYGFASPVRPGAGFLTFTDLQEGAARLGRRARFYASRGPLAWRARRLWSRRRLGRAPAAFGVWVAR